MAPAGLATTLKCFFASKIYLSEWGHKHFIPLINFAANTPVLLYSPNTILNARLIMEYFYLIKEHFFYHCPINTHL